MQHLAPSHTRRLIARSRQSGLTLIEFMVAAVIGLILVAGLSVLMANQSTARSEQDQSGRQIENGRYALAALQADIQHAGYYGQYSYGFTAPTVLPNPCDLTGPKEIDANMALPIQGYDSPTSVPAPLSTCLPDANHVSGTDILVIRRLEADDSLPPVNASLLVGQFYVQTTPAAKATGLVIAANRVKAADDTTTGAPTAIFSLLKKDGINAAELRRYVQHIYFVSPCNVYAAGATTCSAAADNGKPVPTLKRLDLCTTGDPAAPANCSGSPGFAVVPLVEGVQNMQIDYGIDVTAAATTPDGTPGPMVTAPALADWSNLMAVQVNLLVRNSNPSAGHSDVQKTYSMGSAGSVGPFSDAYKRHVYVATVRVVNLSQQRE
ncbi:MAG: PilW family protein [Proteobacteria bacterium]|nr:PilW family protein [Pseudomonadota bacterium]